MYNFNIFKLDAAIKVTRYLLLCKYNYKNPPFVIEIDDIPHEALELYKRENQILSFRRDIEDIVKWSVKHLMSFAEHLLKLIPREKINSNTILPSF